jgi:hypothetical protein
VDAASVLARAAVLTRRGSNNSNAAADDSCQQQPQQQADSAQPALQAPAVFDRVPGLMERAAVLQRRGSRSSQANERPAAAAAAAAAAPEQDEEQPEQYVAQLRQLLASQQCGSPSTVGAHKQEAQPAAAASPETAAAGTSAFGPVSLTAAAGEEQPEQYVAQLRQLLAGGQYPPVGADDAVSSGGEDTEPAAANPAADSMDVDTAPHQHDPAAAAPSDQAQAREAVLPPAAQQQQQQQQQVGPASASAPPAAAAATVPDHIRRVLVLASRSLTAGLPAQARQQAALALNALQQQQQQQQLDAAADGMLAPAVGADSSSWQACVRQAEQLHALATVLTEAEGQHWLAALQLGDSTDSSSSSIIQRAYRRLAGLIHPDKCSHPCAAGGFQALLRAAKAAVEAAPAAGADGEGGTADAGEGV